VEVDVSVLQPTISALTQLSRIALAASVRRSVVEPEESRLLRSGEQGCLSAGSPGSTKPRWTSGPLSMRCPCTQPRPELGATELSGS